jgi:hypothetical protein
MDRVIVQPGALPQDTDILLTNLFAMVNGGFKNAAIVGTSTVVAGLACTPTVPASLQVNVGTGSIFALDEIDASAYGSLGTNTANIVKQGILPTAQTLPIAPPVTTGYSQVYLVEAALEDIDAGATVLSYYNSANPSQPFSGPNNSGASNYTQRTCRCVIQLKAGVPATTGTQVTPSADVGFVGLYAITVANATTQITSGLIAQLASAPFFPALPQVPYQVQQGTYIYAGTDTGAANAYVITFAAGQPIPAAYTTGMVVKFAALHANTGASTVNVNGLGVVSIYRASGVAVASGDIVSGQILELTYDGTHFQMTNYLGSGANTNTSTVVDIPYIADSGTQNAIVATYSPAITSLTDGLYLAVKLANTITGAATMNVNGLGAKAVVLGDGTNPPYNVFVSGMDLLVAYSTAMGAFQISNTSAGMFYRRPTSNYNIYVNTSTGSDSLYDGTSATVGSGTSGPFKTISHALVVAYTYAPSQYTITIQVAPGTYTETVATPYAAGPNVVISGSGVNSTIVTGPGNSTFVCQGPNTLTVANLGVTNTGNTNNSCFVAQQGGVLTTNNTQSGSQPGAVFVGANGGTVFPGNHNINGNSNTIFQAQYGGYVVVNNSTFTILGPISINAAFASAFGAGVVQINNVTPPVFVNTSYVNGPKFVAGVNGIVATNGLGINFFPGSVAGSTNNGGQYT